MKVGKSLSEVFAHTVLTTLPSVCREHAHVLNIYGRDWRPEVFALGMSEEYAEMSVVHSLARLDGDGVFLPFLAFHIDVVRGKLLMFTHCIIIHELHLKHGFTAFRTASIEREAVSSVLLDSHSEESFVLYTSALMRMTRVRETHIVRVTVKRTTLIQHLEFSERNPSHKRIRKLKGAILYHLGIETAVGSVIYVFKEDAVHSALDRSTYLLGLYDHLIALGKRA